MRRIISVFAVAALLAAMMIGAPVALAQDEEPVQKFCILHNPNNPHFVEVDEAGAIEHLTEHEGDVFVGLAPCPEEEV